MNSFLYRVAQTFYKQYGQNITNFSFIFPNRRAGIFFQHYIAELAEKPIFSPEILTINECFASASVWQTTDRLSSLFRLYRIYKSYIKNDETFDSFVFWGEMLLSDFEDVDKYGVDAKQLFTNITELKQIDQLFNVFSEKQIEAIRKFWNNFVPIVEGKSQEDFIVVWKVLLEIYEKFQSELISENVATEGMICRNVASRLRNNETVEFLENKQFVFIGFNALNNCERTLFSELQKRNQADFYWDYEAVELTDNDNQASLFYAENIHIFPSKFTIEPNIESLKDKNVELITVPSAVGQAKQTYNILNNIFPPTVSNSSWIKTAIVLPDENLLIPILHSIPQQIEKINVTMGFSLKSTPVSGLIEHIFELQKRVRTVDANTSFYNKNVNNILRHQYIYMTCKAEVIAIQENIAKYNWIYVDINEFKNNDLLACIFTPQATPRDFLEYLLKIIRTLQSSWQNSGDTSHQFQLESDFLYQYYITINRISDVLKKEQKDIEMSVDTLMGLIRQLTAGINIPFVGEPLDGLQIMGVLETRGLDFDNIIIPSFNEGIFPQKTNTNSFIPYNLRRGFNMPTSDYQDAITAYNFYRLIHRAKNIYFITDSRSESGQTGEVSRFFQQLHYHYGININKKSISYDLSFKQPEPIQIEKTSVVFEKILKLASQNEKSPSLSASSINTYIDCPLKFYLTKIEEVEQIDEVKETIEADMFGTLFHSVMEKVYLPFKNRIINKTDLESLINDPHRIEQQIVLAFASVYFKKKNNITVKLEGNNLLIANVIKKYVLQVLKNDTNNTPFKYINSEDENKIIFPIYDGKFLVNIKGFIDRIDEKDGKIRILDYKTGSGTLEFKSIESVFDKSILKRPKFVLQTFLYGLLYKSKSNEQTMAPGIYYMRNVFKDDFKTELLFKPNKDEQITVSDFSAFEEEFSSFLKTCLEEIFNPEIPFTQTENTDNCKYCNYKGICNR